MAWALRLTAVILVIDCPEALSICGLSIVLELPYSVASITTLRHCLKADSIIRIFCGCWTLDREPVFVLSHLS
jgi:hypothetical protein